MRSIVILYFRFLSFLHYHLLLNHFKTKELTAFRTTSDIVIDGILSEEDWQFAATASDFYTA